MGKTPVGRSKAPTNQGKSAGAKRRLMLWMTFMIVFVIWAGYTFLVQNAQISDKSSHLATQQASKEDTLKKLEQLKYEVSRLNDPEYIGQLARKKDIIFLRKRRSRLKGQGTDGIRSITELGLLSVCLKPLNRKK